MRIFVPLLLALAQLTVGGPTQVQDPAYPLKIQILGRNTDRSGFAVRTWGRADLFDGQKVQGFDYQADCNMVFMVSYGDERYSARWKKQDKELERLVSRVGTGKSNKCVLKADLQHFVYEYENGTGGPVVTKPLTQ